MNTIPHNIDNILYLPAKKKALERGIVFEEYLWRLVSTDLSKGRFISEEKIRDAIELHRKLINSNSENFKPFDVKALNGLLTKIQTDMGLMKK